MVSKKEKVKMFTVDAEEHNCRNISDAKIIFENWRKKFYNDPIEILRIKSSKAYIIYYRLKDTAQRRLSD